MTSSPGNRIVVAVEAGRPCGTAVDWGAEEARRCRLPLMLVLVGEGAPGQKPYAPERRRGDEGRNPAEEDLRKAVASVRQQHPQLEISTSAVANISVRTLCGPARAAAALVVGARRPNRLPALFAGEALRPRPIIAHAGCPVVVPEAQSDVRRKPLFVVGVGVGWDGRRHSAAALHYAFEEAARHKAALRVLHIWHGPLLGSLDERAALEECRRLLSQMVAGCQVAHPAVPVHHAVLRGRPARVLTKESAHALGLVLGARGPGWPLSRNSTAVRAIRHARCPVVAVPWPNTYARGYGWPQVRRIVRWSHRAVGHYTRLVARAVLHPAGRSTAEVPRYGAPAQRASDPG
ncbi:universal stress protein [Streptomyces sp. SYP-A7185]|uniref:universal stress protein n=1 Tax=Streptomyces sp. SYP-A7185 TaxID=3040076 RepID=UPI0038F7A7D3